MIFGDFCCFLLNIWSSGATGCTNTTSFLAKTVSLLSFDLRVVAITSVDYFLGALPSVKQKTQS